MGPTYCETPVGLFSFPAEPWNTWSNLVIVAYGITALYLLWKQGHRAYDLYFLALLIVLNGIGSLLWHGTRTGWALTFDVAPGLLFLFTLVVLWSRRLFDWKRAGLILLAFLVLVQVGGVLSSYSDLGFQTFFVGPALAVIAVAGFLMYRSYLRWGRVAFWMLGALLLALVALIMRTIDSDACSVIPMGTHFLWHVFLSSASFLSILFLAKLDTLRSETKQEKTPA